MLVFLLDVVGGKVGPQHEHQPPQPETILKDFQQFG